jgi:dihydroorotate dehydrogenase (NAD+) catalytic subunit
MRRAGGVDLTTTVGDVTLPGPVMCASGTAGHGAELAAYCDLARLGAVVVKSLSAEPWGGNPAPRLHPVAGGMLNSVGLQNPGAAAWRERELPDLLATGARVVVSVWGLSAEGYARVAGMLRGLPPAVVALEVNLSCPNVEHRRSMIAHSPALTAECVAAVVGAADRPVWAKLSPNVTDIVEIAAAALGAGAAGLTLVNTVMGMAIDPVSRRPVLGGGGGGLSGPAIRPVAVRAVHECRAAFPGVPIVGVGGVVRGVDAAELLVAGANAVQVGTATFADPRAPARVQAELEVWCRRHGVARVADLVGSAHGR